MTEPSRLDTLAAAWRDALGSWEIPHDILEQAPASPWVHPPKMFRIDPAAPVPETPSLTAALDALADGGTVLDVGCGGGRSSLPLAPPATSVAGVDEQRAMLDQFADAALARDVRFSTHLGRWPDVAHAVPASDVVVCHHVVYNVAQIVPFVEALTEHARRRVVVELTARHPLSPLNPLWERFWDLQRPSEPSAELFADLIDALGYRPTIATFERERRTAPLERPELVAYVRQRLCLSPSRDPEVDDALGADPQLSQDEVWSIWWDPIPG